MADEKKMKMLIVAGASNALKFKQQNPHSSDDEAIRFVTKEANRIIQDIESY